MYFEEYSQVLFLDIDILATNKSYLDVFTKYKEPYVFACTGNTGYKSYKVFQKGGMLDEFNKFVKDTSKHPLQLMSASSSGHLRFPGFDKNILDGLVLTGNRSNRNRQPGSLCGSIYGQNTTNSSFCFSNSLFQRAARTRRILAAKPRSFPDRSSNFGLTERCQGVRSLS